MTHGSHPWALLTLYSSKKGTSTAVASAREASPDVSNLSREILASLGERRGRVALQKTGPWWGPLRCAQYECLRIPAKVLVQFNSHRDRQVLQTSSNTAFASRVQVWPSAKSDLNRGRYCTVRLTKPDVVTCLVEGGIVVPPFDPPPQPIVASVPIATRMARKATARNSC